MDLPNSLKQLAKEPLLVAFSAGVDSVALVFLLEKVKANFQLAYFNHQLRSNLEITNDIEITKKTAARLNCGYSIGQKDIKTYCQKHKLSLEDGARQARYNFLYNLAKDLKIKTIVTAHHQDDNAETIIMKFLRGSGLKGLSGIEEKLKINDLTLVRPLLSFRKQELIDLVRKHGLNYHEDSSNQDEDIQRNYLRQQIMPLLNKYNNNLAETITTTAKVITDDNNYLQKQAKDTFNKVLLDNTNDYIRIDSVGLRHYHPALQRRVVRLAIEKLQGDLKDISIGYVENFLHKDCNTIYLNEDGNIEVKKS